MKKCFNCEREIEGEVCNYCGYFFTLRIDCPRKSGISCVHTKKLCKEKDNWENCKVFRNQKGN